MTDITLSNQPADEMERLTLAMREALTDSMVERLAVTGANAFEVCDRLTELHKLGAPDTLFDPVTLLQAARNAGTDNIVERLFASFEQLINTVGNEAMGALAENTRDALAEAAEEGTGAAPKGGLLATVSLLSRPESQRSLAFLLSFSQKLQERAAKS